METIAAMGMNKMSMFSEAEYLKYKDPNQPLNVRIDDLMQRMTLEEKIGQMIQLERNVASLDVMKQYFIGTIMHFYFCQAPIFVWLIYCNIERNFVVQGVC